MKIVAKQSLHCVISETFTVNVYIEILFGYELHLSLVKNQCFGDLLHVHYVNPVGPGYTISISFCNYDDLSSLVHQLKGGVSN
jgi:hypothetical protein